MRAGGSSAVHTTRSFSTSGPHPSLEDSVHALKQRNSDLEHSLASILEQVKAQEKMKSYLLERLRNAPPPQPTSTTTTTSPAAATVPAQDRQPTVSSGAASATTPASLLLSPQASSQPSATATPAAQPVYLLPPGTGGFPHHPPLPAAANPVLPVWWPCPYPTLDTSSVPSTATFPWSPAAATAAWVVRPPASHNITLREEPIPVSRQGVTVATQNGVLPATTPSPLSSSSSNPADASLRIAHRLERTVGKAIEDSSLMLKQHILDGVLSVLKELARTQVETPTTTSAALTSTGVSASSPDTVAASGGRSGTGATHITTLPSRLPPTPPRAISRTSTNNNNNNSSRNIPSGSTPPHQQRRGEQILVNKCGGGVSETSNVTRPQRGDGHPDTSHHCTATLRQMKDDGEEESLVDFFSGAETLCSQCQAELLQEYLQQKRMCSPSTLQSQRRNGFLPPRRDPLPEGKASRHRHHRDSPHGAAVWRRQDVVGKKDTSRSASSVSPASASALSSSKSSRSSSSPSPSPTTTSAVESPSVRSLTTSPAAVAVVPARLSGNVGSDHMLHDMQIHLRDDDEDGEQQTPEEPYHPAGKASPTVRVVTTDGREGWEIPRTSVAGLHTGSTHPVVQGRSISNSSSGISCRTPGGGEQRYPRTEYPVARRERGSSPLVQKSHHQRRGGGVPYTDSSMTSQMALVLRSAVEAGALDRVDADEVFQFLFEIFSEERMVDESRQTGSVDVSHPSLAHHHEDKGEEREYGKAPHYHYHGRIVDRCGENVSIELQEPSPLSFARANANGHHSYPSRRKSSDASLSDLQELRSQLETRKFVHD